MVFLFFAGILAVADEALAAAAPESLATLAAESELAGVFDTYPLSLLQASIPKTQKAEISREPANVYTVLFCIILILVIFYQGHAMRRVGQKGVCQRVKGGKLGKDE